MEDSQGFVVTEATSKDVEGIVAFQCLMAKETEGKTLDPAIVTPAVRAVFDDSKKGFYLVARDEEKLVGCLLVTYEWSDWRNCNLWYFQSVFIEQAYRGQGVFSRMYSEVLERASKANVMFVRLYVETENKQAQKVYEKLGMKRMPYFMYDVQLRK